MNSDPRAGLHLPPGQLAPVNLDTQSVGIAQSAWSSIGKKYLMAWTGLIWCGFVLMHMLGNLVLYVGQDAYNAYSKKLADLGPLLIVAEVFLVAFLLVHIVAAIVVTLQNSAARPIAYEVDKKKGGRSFASNTMIWTGLVVIAFIILHLIDLKFGGHEPADGQVDWYSAVIGLFQKPLYVIWYLFAVVVLGFHVSHALQSGLRTIGWNSETSFPRVKAISIAFGVIVAVGYGSIPLWAALLKGGGA